jgi:hypothetical protein
VTSDEFMERVGAAVEQLALLYAATPHDAMEQSLAAIADKLRDGWRQLAPLSISDADVGGAVDDVLKRVRARRREIEAASGRTMER